MKIDLMVYRLPVPVSFSGSLDNAGYDSVVVVASEVNEVKRVSEPLFKVLQNYATVS